MSINHTNIDNEKTIDEQPSISIVDSHSEKDPVADLIRNQLEEEFLDTSSTTKESKPTTTTPIKSASSTNTPSHKENSMDSLFVEQEEGYYYVNVMEPIVRKKASDYMQSLGMCTCNRCLVDTMALALTNLPAKYVVVRDNSFSPLLNYYSDKLEGEVTIQVIKACMLVKDHPHHKD